MSDGSRVLKVLAAAPDGLPAGEVAKAAHLKTSRASQVLVTLWQAGVVTRVDGSDDMRQRIYALSPVGRAMIDGRAA